MHFPPYINDMIYKPKKCENHKIELSKRTSRQFELYNRIEEAVERY